MNFTSFLQQIWILHCIEQFQDFCIFITNYELCHVIKEILEFWFFIKQFHELSISINEFHEFCIFIKELHEFYIFFREIQEFCMFPKEVNDFCIFVKKIWTCDFSKNYWILTFSFSFGPRFRANVSKMRHLSTKNASWNSSADSPDSPEMGSSGAGQTLGLHARGARMKVVPH